MAALTARSRIYLGRKTLVISVLYKEISWSLRQSAAFFLIRKSDLKRRHHLSRKELD
jgi:hypothetical protein